VAVAGKERPADVMVYGWGPKQIEDISNIMTESGFEVVATEKIKYVPSAEDLRALVGRVSEKIK
jgi:flavorubredoxin